MPHRSKRSRRLAVIGTILAVVLLVGFVSFPLLSGLVAPLVPARVEDAVGAEMIKDTASDGSFCIEPKGMAALQALVERLAVHAPDHEFKLYVSSQEVVNAFAAPGAHMVLFQPIITEAEGPNEVAGVLAHEMGHVIELHPTEGLVEAVGYGIFGMLTPGGEQQKQVAKALLTNHYSRSDELDADRKGVQLLNAAGIDSHGLFSFFARLQDSEEVIPGAVEFMSTHPSGDTRKANLQDVVADGEPALSEPEWAALQHICDQTGAPEAVTVVGGPT